MSFVKKYDDVYEALKLAEKFLMVKATFQFHITENLKACLINMHLNMRLTGTIFLSVPMGSETESN